MKKAKELVGQKIEAIVVLNNYTFPRSQPKSGDFAIVKMRVKDILSGEIPEEMAEKYLDGSLTITVSGNMPKFEEGMEYRLVGKLVVNKKYGPQYECEAARLNYNLDDEQDQKNFFSFFMSDRLINLLFDTYENPMQLLADKDIAKLTKIKGIGPATAMKLCTKYEECKNNGRAYASLKDLGLSKKAIDNLVKRYGSPDVAIDKVTQNPYILIKEVRGYGWKKADELALKQGFTRDCKDRVLAYTKYYLETQGDQNGNSWVYIQDLLMNVSNECAPVTKENLYLWIKESMITDEELEAYRWQLSQKKIDSDDPHFLYYEKEDKKIGLLSVRLTEKKISENLVRMKEAEPSFKYDRNIADRLIEETEKEQGYEYTDEQKAAIYKILDNNVSILTGPAGCVDKDTEFFTGTEWKKISEYKEGDKVLVYHEDGTVSLELPERYIKLPCDQLWLVKSERGVNMCLSEEHQVYYETSKGNLFHKSFAEVKEMHEKSACGFSGKFYTSFVGGGKGINLSDAEIKVMLAVMADGSFLREREKSKYCRFHIKKTRKKEKLREVFTEAGMKWREHESAAEGYTDFYVTAPRREKEFMPYWYDCSHEQLQLICDNILFWDGSLAKNRRRFSTNSRKTADFVQYAFSACGYKATIRENNRIGREYITSGKRYVRKSVDYAVIITPQSKVTISSKAKGGHKVPILPYKTLDGYKYCFTVSTHMWIMRRGGRIMMTGNCGKTSSMLAVTRILNYYNVDFAQCALSGRASSNLSEITGSEGMTIHRLLRYLPDLEGFAYTKNHPLPQSAVILDEVSMVGGDLFLSLVEAIRSGSKLIMIGDPNQLESIGLCNILKDSIQSGYIPVASLTKIHRQAARSGIIVNASLARMGTSLIKSGFIGEETRGDLKDFKVVATKDPALVPYNIQEEYKLLLAQRISYKDIQIIVPMRLRGALSCRALNNAIQPIANPSGMGRGQLVNCFEAGMQYQTTFNPGDRIIINHNDYKAKTVRGEETAIFNGNIGFIVAISSSKMIIKLKDQDEEIELERDSWFNVSLAYAITCHKSQGTGIPYVIFGLNSSCYVMYSRELVYTAITRAKKYCVVCAQPEALNSAVHMSRVKIKQTWLKDDLHAEFMKGVGEEANFGF